MPDIPLWNKCDNRCVMCANTRRFTLNAGRDYLLKPQAVRLERHLRGAAAYRKNARVPGAWNLTGGEPALNPEFLKTIAYFRRRLPGEPLTLLSNARSFADRDFASAFVSAAKPPFTLAVSLHGPSAAAHDSVAGVKGAFQDTLAGLENILSLPGAPFLEIRVILHRLNYRRLGATLKFIKRVFRGRVYRVVVMHYEHEGRGARNQAKLAVSLSDTARAAGACARLLLGFVDARLYHFPLCLLKPGLRRLSVVSLPPEDRVYPPACRACGGREGCVGLMRPYLRRYGAAELRPLPPGGLL
jgi:MoaA/NifB/PqqE/SkfB family radical SAM enzyme